jgi:SAM-dependent methyltransferase
MSSALDFDEAASRLLEQTYTTDDVAAQRRRVLELLALRPGEHLLDVGVGPGLLALEAARAVGPTGRVCGIDVSPSMLAIARRRAGEAGVELAQGGATAIPYSDASFDVAVSTQVLEYVADVPAALAELQRVVRPGGRVLLLDTDWDSVVWRSDDDVRTARVLTIWDQHLADPHLPRRLCGELRAAGFDVTSVEALTMLNVGYEPRTFSGCLLEQIAAFVAGRSGLSTADAQAWAADVRGQGADYFFSLDRFIFRATRG